MSPAVRPYDIGCKPSPSVPAETLIQDGLKTYLLFFAVSQTVQENGYLRDLGVAILECVNSSSAKMGYPNDEGLPEHSLWDHGLSSMSTSILEVVGSRWLSEIRAEMDGSAKRIWGGRGMDWTPCDKSTKHLIVTLKEATFECIAEDLKVVEYAPDFDAAFAYVIGKLKEH